MNLFKKLISLHKDVSFFVIEVKQQGEVIRSTGKASSCPHALHKLPEPQFTVHKRGHQQYRPHKVVENIKCDDSNKGISTVLDS